MAERPIIARARTVGTRRLVALPRPEEGHGGLPALPPGVPADEDDGYRGGPPVAVGAPAGGAGTRPTGLAAFLAQAQRQGAELVSAAREQAQDIARAAREEGHAAGYEEGRARAEAEVGDLLTFAENAVREAVEARSRMLAEAETDIVRLAISVAEKIVRADVAAHPERVQGVLAAALRKTYVRDRLQVACAPEDLELLTTGRAELEAQVGSLRHLELVADRRVSRGGVVVRTDAGDVDATIEGQLERIAQALVGDAHGGPGLIGDDAAGTGGDA